MNNPPSFDVGATGFRCGNNRLAAVCPKDSTRRSTRPNVKCPLLTVLTEGHEDLAPVPSPWFHAPTPPPLTPLRALPTHENLWPPICSRPSPRNRIHRPMLLLQWPRLAEAPPRIRPRRSLLNPPLPHLEHEAGRHCTPCLSATTPISTSGWHPTLYTLYHVKAWSPRCDWAQR